MPVNIIDTLKPKNGLNFPVVEAIDVFVDGFDNLADAVSHFATDVMIEAINAVLSDKANTSDVNTAVSGLQAQIDQIAQASGTGSADTEVAQARVSEDGTTYNNLKVRLDTEQHKQNVGLSRLEHNLDSLSDCEKLSFLINFESGNLSDGEPVTAPAWSRTADYIDVSGIDTIYFEDTPKAFFLNKYGSSKQFIDAVPIGATVGNYDIDTNVKFIKIAINLTVDDTDLNDFKINYFSKLTNIVLDTAAQVADKANKNDLVALSNDIEDIKNVTDIELTTSFESGNLSSGEPIVAPAWSRSADYIDVSDTDKINLSGVSSAFFLHKYNSQKQFISATPYAATTDTITIDATTNYIKFTFNITYTPTAFNNFSLTYTPKIKTEINDIKDTLDYSQVTEFGKNTEAIETPYAGTYNNTNINKSSGVFILLDVSQGDVFGYEFDSGTLVMAEFSAFNYDANTMTKVGDTISTVTSGSIVIREGVHYLLIQSSNMDITKDIKYTINGISTGGIMDVVTDIQKKALSVTQTDEPCVFINGVTVSGNNKSNVKSLRNDCSYPFYPTWGGEYLAHYYNLLSGRNVVTIALDGDSITAEGYRNEVIDDIMSSGGYLSLNDNGTYNKLYTLENNGMGSATSQEWVGTGTPYDFNGRTVPANGFLEESMAMDPDLLVVAWGINDAAANEATTTISERLAIFAANMEEGLKRIRGNTAVDGKAAYNRSAADLSIIICSPTMANKGASRKGENWHIFARKILADIARKYSCAFVDFSIPTYDVEAYRYLENDWGDIGVSDSGIHPSQAFTKYYASILQPLILPFGFWKDKQGKTVAKSGTLANRPNTDDVPVGYRYFCTDTIKNIYCSERGNRAVGTFTIGTISDESTITQGYFRIGIGSASQRILISTYTINNAISSGNMRNYLAKYISECLNARGFHSTCNANTFTYDDIRLQPTSTIFYDDGYSGNYPETHIPITTTITTAGAYNSWIDSANEVIS